MKEDYRKLPLARHLYPKELGNSSMISRISIAIHKSLREIQAHFLIKSVPVCIITDAHYNEAVYIAKSVPNISIIFFSDSTDTPDTDQDIFEIDTLFDTKVLLVPVSSNGASVNVLHLSFDNLSNVVDYIHTNTLLSNNVINNNNNNNTEAAELSLYLWKRKQH